MIGIQFYHCGPDNDPPPEEGLFHIRDEADTIAVVAAVVEVRVDLGAEVHVVRVGAAVRSRRPIVAVVADIADSGLENE